MLVMHNVTRKYGDNVAVDGVHLRIAQGEVVGLLGHNGAGKTTLMKMLTGYPNPQAGTCPFVVDVVEDRIKHKRKSGTRPNTRPFMKRCWSRSIS